MAQVCEKCFRPVFRTRWVRSGDKMVGIDCGCLREHVAAASVNSAFGDLTLAHIHGEDGKPIRVTSIHQLRAAEKQYGFKHHVANMDHSNVNDAPSHRPTTVGDHYKRQFAGR